MSNNKPELTMVIGLPGSGKSSYAEQKAFHDDCVICSSDEIRKEIFGDINCQNRNEEVFQVLYDRVKENLRSGRNVIFDATNVGSRKRMGFLRELRNISCTKVAAIIATPYETCLRNNWMRERRVPNEVLERMYTHWQTPYYFEGWDDIKIYTSEISVDYLDTIDRLDDYNQNNPYHKLSLGDHMVEVYKSLKRAGADDNTKLAGLLHDIGKPFTRFEDENGISHYYGHQSVGAYDALATYGTNLEVSALISYHMRPMDWAKSDNADELIDKYKELWGEGFVNKLLLINKADKENA